MPREKTTYLCSSCGYRSVTWLGRCPQCGSWDSLEPQVNYRPRERDPKGPSTKIQTISEIGYEEEERLTTSIQELDRVLGGGLVKGSLILLGGDPGIGKSTLALQILHSLSQRGFSTLYISGEESLAQLKIRAERLGARSGPIHVMGSGSAEEMEEGIKRLKPSCVVLDSIQTCHTEASNAPLGSISQLRDVTLKVMRAAKENNVCIILIGHVTKEGIIAGPRLLEHMVDTVLYLEGENHQPVRILRVNKNRFGPTFEMAVFEMREKG
ncbi:MAG: ATPase domain-containing protein, partial [Desulfatiglandales bacterium]